MPRHARRGQESGGVANEQALVPDAWRAGPLAEAPDPLALVRLGASSGGSSDEGQPADAPDDAVAIYLREIGRRALLTAREERELGRCVEDGRVLEDLEVECRMASAGGTRFLATVDTPVTVDVTLRICRSLADAWPLLPCLAEAGGLAPDHPVEAVLRNRVVRSLVDDEPPAPLL